jgi:ribosome recycling factor
MPESSKADDLKDSLKIAVKRRGNLRRIFTNASKKLAPIFAKHEIAEDDIEQLKASQQKLLDARPEMRELTKEIQNILVILGDEETAVG